MSEPQKITKNADTGRWAYVKLKDGRNIASPKSGGRLSKAEIREAVRVAIEGKKYKSAE